MFCKYFGNYPWRCTLVLTVEINFCQSAIGRTHRNRRIKIETSYFEKEGVSLRKWIISLVNQGNNILGLA
jgi:hypothetical protein